MNSTKRHLIALAIALLPLCGCVTTDSSSSVNDGGMQRYLDLKAFKGIPVEDIRGVALQSAMAAVIVTDGELIFSSVTSDGWHTPQFRVPLNQITGMSIVSDAYGFTTSFVAFMGLNPLQPKNEPVRSAAYAGIGMTFRLPVVKNFYSRSDREIAFDVFNFGIVENGRVVDLTTGGKADPAAAQKLMDFISARKDTLSTPTVTGGSGNVEEQLKALKALLDKGLIDRATYDARSAEILKKM